MTSLLYVFRCPYTGLNSHNLNIQMQPTLIEKICGNLNFNEYLLVGYSRVKVIHISLKCQRYIMTFSSPHHQIFIEHFNFRRFFSNSTEILYPLYRFPLYTLPKPWNTAGIVTFYKNTKTFKIVLLNPHSHGPLNAMHIL